MRRRRRANTKPQSETLRPRIGPKSIGRFGYHYAKLELASRVTSFNPVSPALGSCSQKKLRQGRTDRCPDCKQSCPCRREPRRKFAFGLSFARFEIRLDPTQARIRMRSWLILGSASIRRSSLSSTTLSLISPTLLPGMFTVIDATLRLPLTEYGVARFATDICLARDSTTTIMTLNNADHVK